MTEKMQVDVHWGGLALSSRELLSLVLLLSARGGEP